MGDQLDTDPTAVGYSSIALLQERFRKLQRVREKRHERDLLKLFSEPTSSDHQPVSSPTPTTRFDDHLPAGKFPFQPPETIFRSSSSPPPPPPPHQDGLSLSSNPAAADFRTVKTGKLTNFWSSTTDPVGVVSASHNFETPEVDTSLHL